MKCESCNNKHKGEYGSGRFCSEHCARSFASKEKRLEINKKVSSTLTGRSHPHAGIHRKLTLDEKGKISLSIKNHYKKLRHSNPIEKLTKDARRRRIIEEQNHRCLDCGMGETWNGKVLSLQLDHIDGDSKNNNRNNLQALCPNCHSQTPTYCRMNSIEKEIWSKKNLIQLNKARESRRM